MNERQRTQDDYARSLAAALVPSDLPPVNILIVDDEPRNLTVLETLLDDPGYRLVRAESPDLALLALVNEEFALLILDVQMPGMTGFELAQTIKRRKKTAQIPIIFLTAHFNDDAHVLEGYGTGAVDYLLKPVNAAALRSKVAVFTELHRRGRDLALANRALAAEVVERTRAEDELRRWNEELDRRVADRTAALGASNARLRMATEAIGLGFWLWNLDSDGWVWENEWPATLFGRTKDDWPATSQGLAGLLAADDQPRFAAALAAAASGPNGRLRFSGCLVGPACGERAVEIDGQLVGDGASRRTMLGTIRDVSERYRAERALQERERFLTTVTEAARIGIAVIDPDHRYRFVNEAFPRILLAPAPITAGQRVGEVDPARWQGVRPAVDRALAGESLSIEFSVPGAPGDGGGPPPAPAHVCAFLEPHTDANGARTVAVVLLDITPLKTLEAELRDADRQKDEFLATLAHELRNPLAPVRNAVSILQLGALGNAAAVRAAAIIERQVKVMARLIDDLMDVARINQGRLELQLAPLALADVLSLAIEGSRPQIEEMGHRLDVVPHPPLPPVLGDATRLAQVFLNILTNAAKYTERGGRIEIACRVDGGQVEVAVRDNGIGIAAENIDRVFEMFSQVEVALARSRGGLGIGLSLARRLVEMHGGRIAASSAGLGQGSEFRVVLPVAADEPRVAEPPGAPAASTASPAAVAADDVARPAAEVAASAVAARRPLRVLVADDNRDGAETLAALLEIHGFVTALAFDGEMAVERAEDFRPEVALLDIGMPKLNGYDVCRALRAMSWAGGLKVIAITGWGDANARQAAVEAGFDLHFVKPVSEERLLAAMAELTAPDD